MSASLLALNCSSPTRPQKNNQTTDIVSTKRPVLSTASSHPRCGKCGLSPSCGSRHAYVAVGRVHLGQNNEYSRKSFAVTAAASSPAPAPSLAAPLPQRLQPQPLPR